VVPVQEPSFPLDVFNFKSFADLLSAEHLDESKIFDIMGEVVGKEEPREVLTSKGVRVKRMVVVLQDLGFKVEVVAFDGTACITLLLWDRECKYLCEIEANDLLKKEVNDSEEHHSHLDKMLDKK
ncbi:hypothetical protein PIB30_103719, partial [Stylosanthes scabra]|nr:hypothetical protein [Stylosanthes scabra]